MLLFEDVTQTWLALRQVYKVIVVPAHGNTRETRLQKVIAKRSLKKIFEISSWNKTKTPPQLRPGALHLWKIPTGKTGAAISDLWPLLSPRERGRAERLRLARFRDRYVQAHAGLRLILSSYLPVGPRTIVLKYGSAGKPRLSETQIPIEFNLTTSGDLALVAVSMQEQVGVDCEQIRERANMIKIAKRMFPPEEARQVAAATESECLRRFYLAWTALEAEVKADGRGLFRRKEPSDQETLEVMHCVPEPGFIAAVARKNLPQATLWEPLQRL